MVRGRQAFRGHPAAAPLTLVARVVVDVVYASFRGHPAAAPLTQVHDGVGGVHLAAFRGHPAAAPSPRDEYYTADSDYLPSAAIRPRPH